jgi:hypothetical protein
MAETAQGSAGRPRSSSGYAEAPQVLDVAPAAAACREGGRDQPTTAMARALKLAGSPLIGRA